MDRSTITRAIHEIRPLLAQRGFAVPHKPELRLRTLADVFAYAATESVHLRMDGTEVRVRRSRANKPGRRAGLVGPRVGGGRFPRFRRSTFGSTQAGKFLVVTALSAT